MKKDQSSEAPRYNAMDGMRDAIQSMDAARMHSAFHGVGIASWKDLSAWRVRIRVQTVVMRQKIGKVQSQPRG